MISFVVQGRPEAKQSTRIGRSRTTGRVVCYRSAKVDRAENSFLAQALPYKPERPHHGPVRVCLTFHVRPPENWPKWKLAMSAQAPCDARPDVDNLSKLALDAMKGVFFWDDTQVFSVTATKFWSDRDETLVSLSFLDPLPTRKPKEAQCSQDPS